LVPAILLQENPKMKKVMLLSVALVAVVTYLTVLDNFFISDDFVMLSVLRILETDPLHLWRIPPEIFRVTSYIYFMACYQLFGLNSVLFYAAGIGLHLTASVLVFLVVAALTRNQYAGWAAGLFFAAYERHQEAVMWISAANDSILTVNALLCLICWDCYLHAGSRRGFFYAASLLSFAAALFSKEAAIALLPCIILMAILLPSDRVSTRWRTLAAYLPFFVLASVYLTLWFSQRPKNFFFNYGFYSFGPHFFGVYARSVARLSFQALVFLAPLFWLLWRRRKWPRVLDGSDPLGGRWENRALLFFAGVLLFATAPYCFVTYLDHIPSRNSYFPSVGLAAIIGIVFVQLYRLLEASPRMRVLVVSFFLVVVLANAAYIWLRKEAQYVERAAPTRALLEALDPLSGLSRSGKRIYVQGFPLEEIIGKTLVEVFTPISPEQVVFGESPRDSQQDVILRWDGNRRVFLAAPSPKGPGKVP
jgi:hypothetical protein